MTTLITEDDSFATDEAFNEAFSGDRRILTLNYDDELSAIEFNTLHAAVDWSKVAVVLDCAPGLGKTHVIQMLARAVRQNPPEKLRSLDKKKVVKTKASLYYLKLVAMRPLLRMQVLLRQKLAGSAPVARLVLVNRARRIFVTHPPVAPPKLA
jgi:hypothetical protein